ncbi:kinase-like domain-containing protein [Mycena sp. CBHHK59/15]|nr:kinase-like domain-containing protein [Mycena sp. CBHHK59/15]
MCSSAGSLPELPEHLARDPGLAALVKAFRMFLEFSEDSADVLHLVESYTGLVAEATRVMKKRCTGSYPIAQGGFNTVFLLTFEDGTDALARLRGGPSAESAAFSSDVLAHQFLSEVATIAFVRTHTSIPVPELCHSDSDANNALGTPYMLMKRISGESLGTSWASMSREQREGVVSEVAHIEAQLLRAPLPMIGSIIADNGTVGPLAPSSTDPDSLRDPHRGPFASSKRLVEAHLRCELSLISNRNQWTLRRTEWRHLNGGVDNMPVAYAIRWFSLLLAAIHAVPSEELDDPAHFTLYHDDLTLNNILVSPSRTVVGLVDWQGSRVRPLWDTTRHTHFLQDENLIDDRQEWDALQKIQRDVIFKETGLHPGSSRLRLAYLLHIAAYSHSIRSSRAHLDHIFLQWFANVVSDGNEERLEPFLPLKLFIEAHRPSARV